MAQRTAFISFPLSEEQENRLAAFTKKVRQSDTKKEHASELATVVKELVDAGLDHFFLKPVQLLNLGMVAEKMIKMGIKSGKKTLNVIATKVIKNFTSDQVETTIDFLESLQLEVEVE